jgi:phosphoenolpyruvate---glycerone phosphotransferase subunit DhaL
VSEAEDARVSEAEDARVSETDGARAGDGANGRVTGGEVLGPADLARALLHACQRVRAARAELSALDAVAGDGDLGESLAIGFAAVAEALAPAAESAPGTTAVAGTTPAAGPAPTADAGTILVLAGTALSRAAPSTFGTLLGMAWRDAGRELGRTAELSAADVVRALDAMAAGVAKRGEVVAGQRTVLDGLLASRDTAAKAAARGAGAVAAIRAAAAGAREGAAATTAMRPQVGRAGWIGDRARGNPDAGATAWAVIASALAEELSGERPGESQVGLPGERARR